MAGQTSSESSGGANELVDRLEEIDEKIQDPEKRWKAKTSLVNGQLFADVVRRTTSQEAGTARTKELIDQALHTNKRIRQMALVAFVGGFLLIFVSVALTLFQQGNPWAWVGFGGIGIASILGVLWYRPMERVNRATSDLVQQVTLLRTWSIAVDLELLAADTFDRDTVREAAARLQSASRDLSRSIQHYVETEPGLPDEPESEGSPPETPPPIGSPT